MQYQIDLLSRPVLSINECAQILGLSYQTIRRHLAIGKIKAAPHSGNEKILVYTDSILKYLNGEQEGDFKELHPLSEGVEDMK